ncbi:hypothetical protein LSH36_97g07070 [Paralvinella palmiformis]|uniref:Peptidase M14 domain-containing protein n=1 Tax=Paralvinella palmiformis TaxID=53620 RepID=A0AAD9NCT9_9ANNE|nr:hypothetical protein LSH36_97g07070 [Paralvinella palmiformis]
MADVRCFVVVLLLPVILATVSYDGYRTFRVTVADDDEFYFLKSLFETHPKYDVWKEARRHGDHVDVMVAPDDIDYFTVTLKHKKITFNTMIEDVGALLTTHKQEREARQPQIYYDFTTYHTLEEIEGYLNELQGNYSSQVTLFDVGTSYEGRTIRGAKLLNFYGTDPEVTDLLDNIDIYYVPVVNVDGYEYTWTSDRLWRKTRSPNEGSPCVGTDPNRNWEFFWCEQGSSTLPCSDAYCGSSAFSEVEVSSTATYLQSVPNLQMFLSFHAYGQWYMTPWAHYIAPPDNYDEQLDVCNRAITALMDNNGGSVTFECGTIQSFVGK